MSVFFKKVQAQTGKYFVHPTFSFLCGEYIYFYNDSIAFYDAGCENHSSSISILKWKRDGQIIICKAIEHGEQIAIRKVEKTKGNKCQPIIQMYDIDNRQVDFGLLYIKEGKLKNTIKSKWDIPIRSTCYYRKKKFCLLPDNLYPLFYNELKILPESPFDTYKIYFNLPQWSLMYSEVKSWCYPEIRFSVHAETLFYESAIDDYWISW